MESFLGGELLPHQHRQQELGELQSAHLDVLDVALPEAPAQLLELGELVRSPACRPERGAQLAFGIGERIDRPLWSFG